jgi:hypothetical protein
VLLLLLAPAAPAFADGPAAAAPCPPQPAGASPVPAPAVASSGQPLPEQVLVCVGPRAINGRIYLHWVGVAEKSATAARVHASAAGASGFAAEAMGFLISSYWVLGEADALKVRITPAEVKSAYDHIREQQFSHRGELGHFLRDSGQTVADLLLRVHLNLASMRIQRYALRHYGQSGLARWIRGFQARWKAQTYCAAQYAVPDCGQVLGFL